MPRHWQEPLRVNYLQWKLYNENAIDLSWKVFLPEGVFLNIRNNKGVYTSTCVLGWMTRKNICKLTFCCMQENEDEVLVRSQSAKGEIVEQTPGFAPAPDAKLRHY